MSLIACNGNAETPEPSSVPSAGCAHLGQYVSVGGTGGFNMLANADFTTALLAAGHVKLYEHGNAVASAIAGSPPTMPYAILNAIEMVFGGTGPGEAELGWVGPNYFTLPASYGYYQYQYVNSGLNPNSANVNLPYKPPSAIHLTPANVRAWKMWTQAAKMAGIQTIAPIVAPNIPWERGKLIFPPKRAEYYDINSAFYALPRFEASYGRAISFDTPAKFFLAGGSGPGYQSFIEQAIRWGALMACEPRCWSRLTQDTTGSPKTPQSS